MKLEKKFNVSEKDIDRLMAVFEQLHSEQIWSQVNRDDFTVKRFENGYVNDIACCKLKTDARQRLCKRPTDISAIVVKFTPKEMFADLNRLEFVTINTVMSELKITPQLLYVDENCIINEYIECRNYKHEDDLEPNTVLQLAQLLARIHSANPPISGNSFKKWQKMFTNDRLGEMPPLKGIVGYNYLEHLEKESLENKEKYWSLLSEKEFAESNAFTSHLIKKVNSPLVFSHVDFNRGNRLVKETSNRDGSVNKELWMIDFDYSSYNYRGLDLGRYFSNYRHVDDMFGNEGFPSDEEMKLFLNEYRQECGRIQGDAYLEGTSLKQLICESKVFALQSYCDYFFCLMLYNNDPKGPKKDYNLQSTFNRYSGFKELKERFTKDGTIPFILQQNFES